MFLTSTRSRGMRLCVEREQRSETLRFVCCEWSKEMEAGAERVGGSGDLVGGGSLALGN